MQTAAETVEHTDGIYFGMPFDEYLADRALDFTGIKRLLISPLTFWAASWMNPDAEDVETTAMMAGKALHKRIVEGPEAFAGEYATLPDRGDYPELIYGGVNLKTRCVALGLVKSGTNAEMCARIIDVDPEAQLWPLIEQAFVAENEGKILLTPAQARDIEAPARIVARHPAAAKAFSGGYPEVSIFWTDREHDVRLKTRLDYLKTRAIVELKTFSNALGKPLDVAIAHAVANGRYHVQAAIQMEGVEHGKKFCDIATRDPTLVPNGDWWHGFIRPSHAFVFVFVEQGAASNVRVRELRCETRKGSPTLVWQAGHDAFRRGVALYAEYWARLGEEPWIDAQPMTAFDDIEFPLYMME